MRGDAGEDAPRLVLDQRREQRPRREQALPRVGVARADAQQDTEQRSAILGCLDRGNPYELSAAPTGQAPDEVQARSVCPLDGDDAVVDPESAQRTPKLAAGPR